MREAIEFTLACAGPVVTQVRELGFEGFASLAGHIRQIPYGRTSSHEDPLAVLTENRGTCSSKHWLLGLVAEECGRADVKLMVGIYAMWEANTPGVGAILEPAGVASIPEAHCYLKADSQRLDFTGLAEGVASPFDALLSEHSVLPADLREEKTRLHKEAIGRWAKHRAWEYEQAWSLREACIQALTLRHSCR